MSTVHQSGRSIYFVNAWVDTALIGGLSILVSVFFLYFWTGGENAKLGLSSALLTVIINDPHFSATIYRLYQSRENTRQFPVTAWVLPFVIVAGVAASLIEPVRIAPYFMLLYVIWSPYHYSGQTVGITMVYARRSGFPIGRLERLALSGFVFSTFAVGVINWESRAASGTVFGITFPTLALPAWSAEAAEIAMAVAALAFLGFALRWSLANRRMLPPILLVPALAQYFWFVPGSSPEAYLVFTPLFHSLQYLLIAWAMQVKQKMDREGIAPSWRYVRSASVSWAARIMVLGIMLFIGVPALLLWVDLPTAAIFGIVAAGVNIHHFFVDGVIWKLRSSRTASPLMVGIADLAGPRLAAA
jgi:hypothetical protein